MFALQVLALLNNVIAKITGNAHFPSPPLTQEEYGALRDEYQALIEAATNGSVAAKKARDKKTVEVKDVLRRTADYVRSVANGDAQILATSGYDMAKLPEPINMVGVPSKLVAASTDAAGVIQLRWSKTLGARLFRVEQAQGDPAAGETKWNSLGLVGRQSFVVEGLDSYQAYWFRITALGIQSEGLPSDTVMGRAA